MILEQRYGAAQTALRATEALQRRAPTGQAASPDTFRREMFHTGWQLISEGRATGSLVNLVNAMLWAMEGCDTPYELQSAVTESIARFRHQLNQRVIDTATQGLSVLTLTHRVLIYGYSTTVQYTLQHALRNGHRIAVTCLHHVDTQEHQELLNRIAAIGLTVDSIDVTQLSHHIHHFDAVMVGADTLDLYGLANRRGTNDLATMAADAGVAFFTFCTSEKFLADVFYTGECTNEFITATSQRIPTEHPLVNDRTSLGLITGIITERGPLTTPAVEAWLAAERLHPWLIGAGTILPHP
jgi:translation initiation factor 2B subunit (eIF-2B alpha/beta/delta family)